MATTDKISVATFSQADNTYRFIFRSPYTVTALTQYHIVMQGDYTKSDTVYLAWKGVAAGGYTGGSAKQYNGSTWSAATGVGDFYFNIKGIEYYNGAASSATTNAVTMPSGYDQKAMIGYAYNMSNSNFREFVAHDRQVQNIRDSDATFVTTTDQVHKLTDYSSELPPTPINYTIQNIYADATRTVIVGGSPYLGVGYSQNYYMRDEAVPTNHRPIRTGMTDGTQAYYIFVSGGTLTMGVVSEFEWASGGGADVAEEYLVEDQSIAPGDVVSISERGSLYIDRAEASSTQPVFGIVSTKPGLRLTDFSRDTTNNRAVALNGRVPVRISEENGPIQTGDRLTLSKTKPGFAMKQTLPGQSIGMALESSVGKEKVMTFLNLSYWIPPTNFTLNTSTSTATSTASSTEETFTTTVLDNLMSYVIGVFRDVFQIVFEKGLLRVAHLVSTLITSDQVDTKKLCLEGVCVNKDQMRALLLNAGIESSASSTPDTLLENDSGNSGEEPQVEEEPAPETTTSTPEIIPEETATSTPEVIPESEIELEPPAENP